MPRPVSDLQRLQRPLSDQVLEFLARDSANAFTALEIAAGVRTTSQRGADLLVVAMMMAPEEQRRETLAPWIAALALLEKGGAVTAFPHGDGTYYAHGERK